MYDLDKGDLLREVTVKIGLERIDMQEGIMVEALLNSKVTGLVMSPEFARKQVFKLKKLDRPIYMRNVDGSFNKEGPICYDLRLGLGCNLGKDLRKDRDRVQLVKHKDYRVVSTLYI